MPGSFSDFIEPLVLDKLFGKTDFTPATTHYFALLTDSNTDTQEDAGTVTEIDTAVWTNYARISKTNNTTTWPASTQAGGVTTKTNGVLIDFGTVVALANINVRGFALYDAATGGNMIAHGPLAGAPIVVANGNSVSIAIGAITITQD